MRDRDVVITGGTGGLGRAVVGALLASGARCHVTWLFERELEDFPHRDAVTLHRVDCADEEAVRALYAGVDGLWASLHLIGGFAMAGVTETSLEDFLGQQRINVQTCFLCCREAVRALRGSGGRIVNVAARVAAAPVGGMLAYSTAKGAVAALTRALAAEVLGDGILVNAIAPSIIDTPANRAAMPDADFSTWPRPAELAEAIAFLCSPENTLTTGAVLPVYGRG